jgi:dTDP-4-dehydrorhamnose 3,5-epimerase
MTAMDLPTVRTLPRIGATGGDVLRFVRSDVDGLPTNEVYFSLVHSNSIKAWRRHRLATLRLCVPHGRVRFVYHIPGSDEFTSVVLDAQLDHQLLRIPPGIWFGFQGQGSSTSVIASASDLLHDPDEVERIDISELAFDWRTE